MNSSPSATQPELWAAIAAALGAIGVAAKKLLARKKTPAPDHLTTTQFHQELSAVRDRIAAGYLAIADKIEVSHKELADHLDRHALNVERRLDKLESSVARLDERTRSL